MKIKFHVLVVGDEKLRSALPSDACADHTMVSAVPNLDDARCFIENRKVDLIVADQQLPDGSGVELVGAGRPTDLIQTILIGSGNCGEPADEAIEYMEKSEETLELLPRTVECRVQNWGKALAKKQTSQHQEHLTSIWDATPDFVGTTDIDGFFLHLNEKGREMMGLSEDADLSQIRLFGLLEEESASQLLIEGLPAAVKDGVWRSESILLTVAGDQIPVSQVLIAHKDKDGNVSHFSTILHDLRDVRAAEEERKQLADDLHQVMKMESIGRLAGGVAHDLNNRLTAIIGYAELGLIEAMSRKPCKHELEMVIDSCEKASLLIEQLVAFSRKQAVKPQFLNINEVINETEAMLNSILGDDIELISNLDPGIWPVKFDHSQLAQVVVNLVTNCRDALTSGGSIYLKTSNVFLDEEKIEALGMEQVGDYILFSVTDTGPGIDEETRKHIFEPFYSLSTHGRDGGLGLSSVYGAVVQNNGMVAVGESECEGARFDVYIPREQSVVGS